MPEIIFLRNSKKRMLAVLTAFLLIQLLGITGCRTAAGDGGKDLQTAAQDAAADDEAAQRQEIAAEEGVQPIEVIMIHNNPCESCNEPEKLRKLLGRLAPEQGAGSDCRGTVYYAYQGEGYALVEKAAAYFCLDKKDIVYPFVIVGERYLMGYSQLEDELAECLAEADEAGWTAAMAGEALIADGNGGTREAAAATAEADAGNGRTNGGAVSAGQGDAVRIAAWSGEEAVHLLYFHTEICDKCEKAEAFLETLPGKVKIGENEYPLVITTLSVAEEENALLFSALADVYQVPDDSRQVPFVFVGDTYLSGEKEIRERTAALIEKGAGLGTVYEADTAVARREQAAERENAVLFLLKTAGVGFINGFNPCALSLALLFISLIAALPKGFLRCGFAFLAGKFLAYTLLGLLASAALSAIPFEAFAWLRTALNLVLLFLCVLLAAGNLLDCYHAARGEYGKIRVQLPGKLRRRNDELVKKIVNPKAGRVLLVLIFLGSMAVACGEFFCTGQIYLASILQWMKSDRGSVPMLAFCLYSMSLCMPSFFILLAVNRGKSVFSLTSQSLKGMPLVKLCNAMIFIIFAVLTIASRG